MSSAENPSALTDAAIPIKISRTAVRVLNGEALVMVVDRREMHRLNEVGTRVLQLCDGQHSIAAIAQALANEFEVGVEQASADVKRFVRALLDAGALAMEAPAGASP